MPMEQASPLPTLQDFTIIQPGFQFRQRIEPDPEGNACIVQLKDIGDSGPYHLTNLTRIKNHGIPEKYLLRINDLLIPSRGTKTYAIIIKSKPEIVIVSGYFYIVRVKTKKINPDYLCWFLNSRLSQRYLSAFKRGTSIPSLAQNGLHSLKIVLPALDVQKRIASYYNLSKEQYRISTKLRDLRYQQQLEILLRQVENFK